MRFSLLPAVAALTIAACSGGSSDGSTGTANVDGSGSQPSGGTTLSRGSSSAAALAANLGRENRLLIGLGTGADPSDIATQGLAPDIYDEYLVGAGVAHDWPTWNSDPNTGAPGYYVDIVAAQADAMGAVPMFTLYQMASFGDQNLSHLTDSAFMSAYWSNVELLFEHLATYGKPALVNFEPDFWGYVEQQAPNGDPTQMAALVHITPDCASLPDDATGIATCLLTIARKHASNAYVGFPPSDWGGNTIADVVAFMNQIGAGNADFVVMQTLDRDAGCFEAQSAADSCTRTEGGWYWDETNTTSPNFQEHLQTASTYHQGLNRPLIWWQTPLGVPSSTPGGTNGHFRDNRVHYFLTHPQELTAVGGLGVVFSTGEDHQTTIITDGGQFRTLFNAYLANPASLP